MKVKRFSARKASTLVCTVAALSAIYWASYAAYALDDQPIASVGAMEFSNFKLSSNALAFRGDYVRSTWDGDLLGYDVSTAGSAAVKWRAREQLASVAWDTGRKIFTSNPSGTGVAFQWAAANALSNTQKTLLGDSTT